MNNIHSTFWAVALLAATCTASGSDPDDDHEPDHSPQATPVDGDATGFFRNSREYGVQIDLDEQATTYDKAFVPTQRPLIEWGRRLYDTGPQDPGLSLFGQHNLLFPHFMVYGDMRTAAGSSDEGGVNSARLVTRLNLDIDLGLTATERIHALMRPLDKGGNFTRIGLGGDEDENDFSLDGNLETLFFEGDLGAMFGGPGSASIPIALGKIPLLFQNGVWVEDAFLGVAVTTPAKNSPKFNIPNYDITYFAGFDDVTTGASGGGPIHESDVQFFGATGFIEANEGYWELGYAYVDGTGAQSDIDYHNITASFAKRYGSWLSNTTRVIVNAGQDRDAGNPDTADGALLLFENSFITRKPLTLIPYVNLFAGFGTPQSLARDAGAGGVLKNTGINFETDALTRFPALDASGHDAYGAAVGVEYLFDLDRQVVVEIAAQHAHGDDAKALGDELAIGIRYQHPIEVFGKRSGIWRIDAMAGFRDDGEDISGIRLEFRWKF